jgi:hypothetical protein
MCVFASVNMLAAVKSEGHQAVAEQKQKSALQSLTPSTLKSTAHPCQKVMVHPQKHVKQN